MADANAPHEGPEQRLITTDQLFAEVTRPNDAYLDHGLEITTLAATLGTMGILSASLENQGDVEQARQAVQRYSPRLQKVMGTIHGWEVEDGGDGTLPWKQVQRVVVLDGLLRNFAEQPVVIMKPGKTWLDVGYLEKPQITRHNTGLQVFEALPHTPASVQVPVYNTVTIDLRTGMEPEWSDQQEDAELSLRRERYSQDTPPKHLPRPDINPLHTHVILGPEDAEGIVENPATAYILVGYPQLQRVLNPILGFDPAQLSEEAVNAKYNTARQMQQRLAQAGVRFDFDLIDGFLTHRTKLVEQEIAQTGPYRVVSEQYHELIIEQLREKYANLVEVGWIAPTDAQP